MNLTLPAIRFNRLVLFLGIFIPLSSWAAGNERNEAMEANVLNVETSGSVKRFTLEIENKAQRRLSYFMVGIPCGKVFNVSNSKEWPARLDVLDSPTGFHGIRIKNSRAEMLRLNEKITVSFSISYAGEYCDNIMETWHPKIAYNFGTFIEKDTLHENRKDIPEHVRFASLQAFAKNDNLEINAYTNPADAETTIDFVAFQDGEVKLEVFTKDGLKISTMFIGKVEKGVRNLVTFNCNIFPRKEYIYRLSSSLADLYGQLIFPE